MNLHGYIQKSLYSFLYENNILYTHQKYSNEKKIFEIIKYKNETPDKIIKVMGNLHSITTNPIFNNNYVYYTINNKDRIIKKSDQKNNIIEIFDGFHLKLEPDSIILIDDNHCIIKLKNNIIFDIYKLKNNFYYVRNVIENMIYIYGDKSIEISYIRTRNYIGMKSTKNYYTEEYKYENGYLYKPDVREVEEYLYDDILYYDILNENNLLSSRYVFIKEK